MARTQKKSTRKFFNQSLVEGLEKFVSEVIGKRTANAKLLAKKFPEFRGLSYSEFSEKLPIELDFITSCEMFEALNPKPKNK